MNDRMEAMRTFLQGAGWGAAEITPLPGDASTRRYARASLNGRVAMVMDQPQAAEAPVAPTDATPAERKALGYNAVARLAGADCARFVAVAGYLRGRGLSAPHIYAADTKAGFLLLEDLGNDLYADVLCSGGNELELYKTAAEVLATLHAENAPAKLAADKPLFTYDETALLAEADLLTEWYFPFALGRKASAEEVAEHRDLWRQVLKPALVSAPVFVHRDYHAQNLLWLPERYGPARAGLIDFQDAVAGSRAYDLVSLTEDARRDVSPALAAATTAHYINTVQAQGGRIDDRSFAGEMAIMAAQRNAKIVGIFARLHSRDGKSRYLSYLPRVWSYLNADLAHPTMAQLAAWYERTIPRDIRMKDS
jgi:aminoglycoside/choline kinase family phosphotransferase